MNGAICPFTAGELARGAFENGYEEYGWDILSRIEKMVARDDGEIFFLYHPITGKPQGGGPSAWGAAAIINAIDEGLAGIQDLDTGYRVIRFAPRWPVTPYTELRYLTGYEASHKTVDCRYILTGKGYALSSAQPRQTREGAYPVAEGQGLYRGPGRRSKDPFRDRKSG